MGLLESIRRWIDGEGAEDPLAAADEQARPRRIWEEFLVKIAREVASEADLQMRMQGIVLLGAFLKLTPYARESNMSDEQVYAGVEKALRKYFGKRGDRVVQDNLTCVRRGYSELKEIPPAVIQESGVRNQGTGVRGQESEIKG